MRHFGVPSAFITGARLAGRSVKAEYQKICWAMWPWPTTGPDSRKSMPAASGGAYFFSHSMYLVSA